MVIRVFLLLLLSCLPVFAGGVGYVNYDKVVANYQFAKTSLREIETKNNEIQQYLLNKEKEFDKIESAVQKKKFEETVRVELKARENAFNAFREKREEEVYTRIHAVTEKIRLEKGPQGFPVQQTLIGVVSSCHAKIRNFGSGFFLWA